MFLFQGITYLLNSSPTVLVETAHSLFDIINQVLLRYLTGRTNLKNRNFPYGRAGQMNIHAFLSTGVVFVSGIAFIGWQSWMLYSGKLIGSFMPHDNVYSALVLLICAGVEFYTLRFAWRQVYKEAAAVELTPFHYLFSPVADPRTLFIIAEDFSALLCCSVGAVSTFLSYMSDSGVYDIAGSVFISGILMFQFVYVLRRTLIASSNPAIPKQLEMSVYDLLQSDDIVDYIANVKSTVLAPMMYRYVLFYLFTQMQI